MIIARQSTARTVMIGPVLDATGVAVTDCVVADFEGSVNGGDPAALNGSATLTHRGVGFYSLALTATDLATVGSFEVTINDTVNACATKEITVIEEVIYDALFAASANTFTGAAGSNAVRLVDTLTTYTGNTVQTGDSYARIGATGSGLTSLAPSATALSTATWTGTRAGYLDNLSAGAVATTSALTSAAADITTLLGKFTGITLLAQWLGLIAGKQTGNSTARTELRATGAGSGTYDETTDSLEANRDNIGTAGAGLTAADDAVITLIGVAGAGLTEAGGDGDHLTAINLPNQTMDITGNITGNLSGSVGSVTGGINTGAGTITTLDALDTAQDTQHTSTLSKMLKYFQLLFRKDAAIATDNATEVTAINADGGSGAGAFANTTDAVEAIRDRGDAAWVSGSGGDATEANQTTIISALTAIQGSGFSTTTDSLKVLSDEIDLIGGSSGSGADSCTFNITYSTGPLAGQAIPDADVWISSNSDGSTVVAGTLQTNSNGRVTFLLDEGSTYYLWCQKDSVNAISGQAFMAVAD